MNARICQSLILGAVLTLQARSAQTNEAAAPAGITQPTNAVPAAESPATPNLAEAPPPAPVDAGTNAGPVKVVRPPAMSLPPLLDQVVRLSERGTDESVVKAYIESAPAYRITGNDIIQLQDVGISQGVILALIERSKTVAPSDAPQVSAAPVAAPSNPATVEPPATPPAEYYDSLAPYGSWLSVPGYGWCWQPTAVVINPAWRPYCDFGDWWWTDCGWYWHSYYSWGWAPFHYGRWYCHPHSGWVWCPDHTWGSAWVSWRHSGSHYGWAPLPPGSHFGGGSGWTHHGTHVGSDHHFGLGASAYTFVPSSHFADHHVGRSAVAGSAANDIYRNSTVANNYSVGPNNRVVNQGISHSQVAAVSRSPIHEANVSTIPRTGPATAFGRTAAPGRFSGTSQTRQLSGASTVARPMNQAFASPRATPQSQSSFSGRAMPQSQPAFGARSAPQTFTPRSTPSAMGGANGSVQVIGRSYVGGGSFGRGAVAAPSAPSSGGGRSAAAAPHYSAPMSGGGYGSSSFGSHGGYSAGSRGSFGSMGGGSGGGMGGHGGGSFGGHGR